MGVFILDLGRLFYIRYSLAALSDFYRGRVAQRSRVRPITSLLQDRVLTTYQHPLYKIIAGDPVFDPRRDLHFSSFCLLK